MPSSFWFIIYLTGLFCDSSFPGSSFFWFILFLTSLFFWFILFLTSFIFWFILFLTSLFLVHLFSDLSFLWLVFSSSSSIRPVFNLIPLIWFLLFWFLLFWFLCQFLLSLYPHLLSFRFPVLYYQIFTHTIHIFLPSPHFFTGFWFSLHTTLFLSLVFLFCTSFHCTPFFHTVQVIAKPYNPRKYRIFRRLILIHALSLSRVHTKAVFRLRYSISKIISGSSGNCLIYLLYTKCFK